ncbi:hypothetical protein AVEN_221380-1 [Araneus ventricosus]|uniref:Uncharacterized protein n=1 Tax=Araneus ventricosus TaxID=182803 RepID=A0A4Y2KRB3_ARAVE|nr:hypothetical protein AVEN_221380-1 [Araneus ventricosus]
MFEIACMHYLEESVQNLLAEMEASGHTESSGTDDESMVSFWVGWLPEGSQVPWSQAVRAYGYRPILNLTNLSHVARVCGGTVQKASPRIPVNSVGGVHLSEPLLAPYLSGLFLLSQAVSQAGDKLPFQSLPLKSSPLAPDWTPGSLRRRFNELRHLLCSVTHGVGKKLLVANDLGGSYRGGTLRIFRRYSSDGYVSRL